MSNYFEIKNLKCSYNGGSKIVLEIDRLEIPRGKVVFIVGQSGCGKSTILETLGLMNNTLAPDANTIFRFTPSTLGGEAVDCTQIWNEGNKKLSEIRRNYFSFIFQDTNLMRNFSIWENAVIPQMIKGGNKRYEDALREVKLDQILNENKQHVGELSGGQKQRLAFVRAFLPNFNILFGDEPTGNLDPDNADKLMQIVYEEIHNNSREIAGQTRNDAQQRIAGQARDDGDQAAGGEVNEVKTAIIVSHSPELSVKYADVIIKIHKRGNDYGDTFGKIDADSIYEKRDGQWFHHGQIISNDNLKTIMQNEN
jgi:ABC-type lipoprotein export system ATPase subunit